MLDFFIYGYLLSKTSKLTMNLVLLILYYYFFFFSWDVAINWSFLALRLQFRIYALIY